MCIPGRVAKVARDVLLAFLSITGVLVVAPAPAHAAATSAEDATRAVVVPTRPGRPRIGLVLGGGGAKGAAHVGVLTMLEDMRVPVDCVIGTSMGALVGGTYAAGMTAAEVDEAVAAISWAEAIGFAGWRQKLPMRRKLAGRTYSNSFEFGFRDGSVAAPSGIINTQNIEQTIRHLVARSLGTSDFDQLPIPFRAIATDMLTGELVVLSGGDLAQAMRASMAVPGVFSPVTIDGRTLGDGSLTRNVAVDIARQTCADVVIAVAVPTPAPPPEALQSPITMIARTLDVLIGANERQQLESLGPQDVKIIVPMGDIGSGAFDRVAEAVPLGRRAAEEQRESLRRYSLPAAEYQAWRESTRRPDSRQVRINDIQVVGVDRVAAAYVEANLGLEAGQQVDQKQLGEAINDVFALGDFDGVQYSLVGDAARPDLRVAVTEKALGPNILRFDLGLAVGTAGANAFVLAADYLRPWINSRGGEVHGLLQVGRNALFHASLYQPVDVMHRWFVEPGARVSRSTEDLYIDDEIASRYNFDAVYAYLDAGHVFGTSAELRVGVRNGAQRATRDIAVPGLPTLPTEAYGGLYASFTYDDRDREALATQGWLHRLRYFRGMDALGSRREYDRLEGVLMRSWPLDDDLVTARAAGGASFQGELPFYDLFTLGGPISFPGLGLGQLRGTSYWTTQASYLHKVADLSPVFGQSLYAGVSLIAGDMSGRLDDVREPTLFGGSLLFGGYTAIGPLTLSLSTTSSEDWSVLVRLGRPVEERTITDPTW
ncbi:MAG TPA: patatin-like phospholipase family protein [Steroidobacteraceae bacterium]|nr:patatin-like phospholipase family protein [Steroidobacteraceae bacterium]